MRYMLMIHQGTTPTPLDPEAWATLSADEQQAIDAEYQAINQTPGVTPGNGLRHRRRPPLSVSKAVRRSRPTAPLSIPKRRSTK